MHFGFFYFEYLGMIRIYPICLCVCVYMRDMLDVAPVWCVWDTDEELCDEGCNWSTAATAVD